MIVNPKHLIDIQVEEQVESVDIAPLRLAILVTLKQQQVEELCEVVVVISDDLSLCDLNQRFRGVGHPTDVLSFGNESRGPFSMGAEDFPRYLGDIVISRDRAQVQAEAVGGTLIQELQLLTVHGLLHLLGYDHTDAAGKAQMWAQQSDILAKLSIDIPLPE